MYGRGRGGGYRGRGNFFPRGRGGPWRGPRGPWRGPPRGGGHMGPRGGGPPAHQPPPQAFVHHIPFDFVMCEKSFPRIRPEVGRYLDSRNNCRGDIMAASNSISR